MQRERTVKTSVITAKQKTRAYKYVNMTINKPKYTHINKHTSTLAHTNIRTVRHTHRAYLLHFWNTGTSLVEEWRRWSSRTPGQPPPRWLQSDAPPWFLGPDTPRGTEKSKTKLKMISIAANKNQTMFTGEKKTTDTYGRTHIQAGVHTQARMRAHTHCDCMRYLYEKILTTLVFKFFILLHNAEIHLNLQNIHEKCNIWRHKKKTRHIHKSRHSPKRTLTSKSKQ